MAATRLDATGGTRARRRMPRRFASTSLPYMRRTGTRRVVIVSGDEFAGERVRARRVRVRAHGARLSFLHVCDGAGHDGIRVFRERLRVQRDEVAAGSDSSLAEAGVSRVDGPVRLERHFAVW